VSAVPRRFVGAWEREELRVDRRPVPDIGRAVWIEAGGTYVDVRAPGDVASGTSFGGRSTWRSPVFTWHHDLDLHPSPGPVDRGELSGSADRIIERGTGLGGGNAPYEEHWRRLPSASAVIAVVSHEHGLGVRAGDHAALVLATPRPSTACARVWHCTNGRWVETITLGAPRGTPVPHGSGWRPTRGWTARGATGRCADPRRPGGCRRRR
jgi:hypothetical protein